MARSISRFQALVIVTSGVAGFVYGVDQVAKSVLRGEYDDLEHGDFILADTNPDIPTSYYIHDPFGIITESEISDIAPRLIHHPYSTERPRNEVVGTESQMQWEYNWSHLRNPNELSPDILNLTPYAYIDVHEIPVLAKLESLLVPGMENILLESILSEFPACTKFDVFPLTLLNQGDYGERVEELFNANMELNTIRERMSNMIGAYENHVANNPLDERNPMITSRAEKLRIYAAEIYSKYIYPVQMELMCRTSLLNLIFERDAHLDVNAFENYLLHEVPDAHCFRWVSNIISILSQITNRPEISPVFKNSDGFVFSKVRGEFPSLNNFSEWFRDYSNDAGWERMSGISYDELREKARGKLIVAITYDEFGADHSVVLRNIDLGDGSGGRLCRAHLNGSVPSGTMYDFLPPDYSYFTSNTTEFYSIDIL